MGAVTVQELITLLHDYPPTIDVWVVSGEEPLPIHRVVPRVLDSTGYPVGRFPGQDILGPPDPEGKPRVNVPVLLIVGR